MSLLKKLCVSGFVFQLFIQAIYSQSHCSNIIQSESIPSLMTGFNPSLSDPTIIPNPGIKSQIFASLHRNASESQQSHSNNFDNFFRKVGKHLTCDRVGHFTQMSINIFENYRNFIDARYSKYLFSKLDETEGNSDIDERNSISKSIEKQNIQEFFNRNRKGEIVEVTIECLSYKIELASSASPAFTDAFVESLKRLQEAIEEPGTKKTLPIVSEQFIDDFGTHFIKTIELGSRSHFQKYFTNISPSFSERLTRKQCVKNLVQRILQSKRTSEEDMVNEFSKDDCNESFGTVRDVRERILVLGNIPPLTKSEPHWNEVPLSIQFENLSELMKSEWLGKIELQKDQNPKKYLNAHLLKRFFENGLKLSPKLLEEHNISHNRCAPGKLQLPDHVEGSSRCADYVTIISGGLSTATSTSTTSHYSQIQSASVYVLGPPSCSFPDVQSLPDVPGGTTIFSSDFIAVIAPNVYTCGLYANNNFESTLSGFACYVLNYRETQLQWKRFVSLERQPTAILNVANSLWIVEGLNTSVIPLPQSSIEANSEPNDSSPHNISDLFRPSASTLQFALPPATAEFVYCAMTNGTHIILLANNNKKLTFITYDITNGDISSIDQMSPVIGYNTIDRCFWYKSEIFVTVEHGPQKDVEHVYAINSNSFTIKKISDLRQERRKGEMAIIDGKLAIMGGLTRHETGTAEDINYIYEALDTIETYNPSTDSWTPHAKKLHKKLFDFASVTAIF